MTTKHEPDPSFLEHLAWQTRTALRREARFAGAVTAPRKSLARGLRVAALVLISVIGGGATVVAAQELSDRRERELLLTGLEIRLEAATLRRDHAATERDRARSLFEAGVVPETEVADAEAGYARHTDAVARLELDRAEVEESGRAPRDDLAAPEVAGRDFVTERLELSARALRTVLSAESFRLAQSEAQYAAGVVPRDRVEEARLRAGRAELDVAHLEARLALRRNHLAGYTTRPEVEILDLRSEAAHRLARLDLELEQSRRMHALLTARYEQGIIGPSESRRAELELRVTETSHRLAKLELERLDARLGR